MSFLHHEPLPDQIGRDAVCAQCGEDWPCTTRKVVVEVAEYLAPTSNKPPCCDSCLDKWAVRDEIREELIDGE